MMHTLQTFYHDVVLIIHVIRSLEFLAYGIVLYCQACVSLK